MNEMKKISGAKGPLTDLDSIACSLYYINSGTFTIDISAVKEYIRGLGYFFQGSFNEIEEEVKINVIKIIGNMFVFVAGKIRYITAERDAQNDSSTEKLPPVMVKYLVVCTWGNCVGISRNAFIGLSQQASFHRISKTLIERMRIWLLHITIIKTF